MKLSKIILYGVLTNLILSSCGSYTIQKKRYSKGFYVSKTTTKSFLVKSTGITPSSQPNMSENMASSTKEVIRINELETPEAYKLVTAKSNVSCFSHSQNFVYTSAKVHSKKVLNSIDFKNKKDLGALLQKHLNKPVTSRRIDSLDSTRNFTHIIFIISALLGAVILYFIVLLPMYPPNIALLLSVVAFFVGLLTLYIQKTLASQF